MSRTVALSPKSNFWLYFALNIHFSYISRIWETGGSSEKFGISSKSEFSEYEKTVGYCTHFVRTDQSVGALIRTERNDFAMLENTGLISFVFAIVSALTSSEKHAIVDNRNRQVVSLSCAAFLSCVITVRVHSA